MKNKRKNRKYDTLKIALFLVFTAAVLALPARHMMDGLLKTRESGIQTHESIFSNNELSASHADAIGDSQTGGVDDINIVLTGTQTNRPDQESESKAAPAASGESAGKNPEAERRQADSVAGGNSGSAGAYGAAGDTGTAGASIWNNGSVFGANAHTNRTADEINNYGDALSDLKYADTETVDPDESGIRNLPPANIVVTISAVGDCTIGYDETAGYQNRFDQVYAANGNNPAYFFENVLEILTVDDLTIANLETVFTESKKKADKAYRFKGPPEYVRILEEGSVEVVNIANNHMFDYFQKGYDDTVATLDNSSVQYFGYDVYRVIEIRGVKIGLAGFHIGGGGWSHRKKAVADALEKLRPETDLLVMSFHWGIEGQYKPTGDQRSLARYCVDNGADLVLGHHPHTLQNIEIYKGRTIAYSLGNFCFGGNRNPRDKDSIILRQSFEFDAGSLELTELYEPEVIPVRVSSVRDRNDYRPTPVEGEDAARVMKKVFPQ